jgi:DNA invertase Pin-like site-specific DNA recombinase
MKQYGYVRVSSRDQNIDRQIIALENIGLEKNQIFIDKESGKDFQRNEYQKMIKKIKDGDQLFVKSIDRLGRKCENKICY